MDSTKIIQRLNSLEAAAALLLIEVRKSKKELNADLSPVKTSKGWSDEKRAQVRARRMKILLR